MRLMARLPAPDGVWMAGKPRATGRMHPAHCACHRSARCRHATQSFLHGVFSDGHNRTKFIIRIFIRQYTKRSFFKLSENGCTAPFHGAALVAIELRMGLWTERLQTCLQSGCFLGQRALAAGLHIKNGIHHLPDAALAQIPSLAHRSKALSLHLLLLISHVAWTHAEICCLSWFWERVSGPSGGRPHGGQ